MASTEDSESLQDLLYGKITDNDLLENIRDWCDENVDNIMIFVIDRPRMRVFTPCEEKCWFEICGQFRVCPNIDGMSILCRKLYGQYSNEAYASNTLLAALADVYEKITGTLLKLAAYEERMRHIQYYRDKERELEKKYPTNQPPAKKPRLENKLIVVEKIKSQKK